MEPNMTNTTAPTTPPSSTLPAKNKPSYGGLLAILIILIAIVVGALYFWGERVAQEPQTAEESLGALEAQGDSTDPNDIEADLQAETPDEFDTNFDGAFGELDAAFEAQ
jgi:uncharacterized protein HemX